MSVFEKYIALSEQLGCTSTLGHPVRVDAMYGMAQLDDNKFSVLHRLETLYARGFSKSVLILGEEACSGFSGFEDWKNYLLSRPHIPRSALGGVVGSTYVDSEGVTRVHSGTEALAAVQHAKINQIRSLALVAPEFHLARAFMHFVTAALLHYPELHVWPTIGEPLSWDEVVIHSQGDLRGTRREIAEVEYQKIHTYKELAPLEDILDYISQRDRETTFRD